MDVRRGGGSVGGRSSCCCSSRPTARAGWWPAAESTRPASVFRRLGAEDVEGELREIQASLDMAHHSLREPFFCQAYLRPILLAVAIAAFNQLSGINALMYYAPAIFKMAGAEQGLGPVASRGRGRHQPGVHDGRAC